MQQANAVVGTGVIHSGNGYVGGMDGLDGDIQQLLSQAQLVENETKRCSGGGGIISAMNSMNVTERRE